MEAQQGKVPEKNGGAKRYGKKGGGPQSCGPRIADKNHPRVKFVQERGGTALARLTAEKNF